MRLDFGGIAKGYAADALSEILRESGATGALVDLGGNILAFGSKPDESPWRIGIQNPFESRGAVIGVLKIGASAVVTSGVYERYSELQGVRYHHILDPFTGYPSDNGLASVTIVTDDAMAADALSTGVFVLGLPKGSKLVEELPTVEAIFVTDERAIFLTSGLTAAFELLDGGFRVVDSAQ
jgi:thiamine biosynthesis lipoprotein